MGKLFGVMCQNCIVVSHNKCRQHRTFGAGQSFRGSICAWLRHYRTNRSTPSLPLLQALSVQSMIHSISQIQEDILDCDGSCRDFNFISEDRIAVSELIAWFYKKFKSISAHGNDGVDFSPESVPEAVIGLPKSSYIQIVGGDSSIIIDKIQIFVCVSESGGLDVEITFFPQDIEGKNFDLDKFLQLINSWRVLANAGEGYLRYENASWVHADVSRESGVIYVSKST